jgi:hypothetical protein
LVVFASSSEDADLSFFFPAARFLVAGVAFSELLSSDDSLATTLVGVFFLF